MGAVRGVASISRLALAAVAVFAFVTSSALADDSDHVVLCDVGISCGNQPSILLKGAANATSSSVIVKYAINTFGLDTSVVISYGLKDSLTDATTKAGNLLLGSGSTTDDEIELNDLPSDQKFFYKITATNADGTTESSTEIFSTLPSGSGLAAETLPATNIGSTTATLNGKVTSNGTNYRYAFSLRAADESQLVEFTPSATNLGSLEPTYSSYEVGSLRPDTTYLTVFGAGAADEGSQDDGASGQELSFKTKPAESATTSEAAPSSPSPASTQTVATTISRLAVGVRSALFNSGKKIHFVVDMSAAGEVSLAVKKLNPVKRTNCKRVSYQSWLQDRAAFTGCKVVLFPMTTRMEVKAGANRLTYRPLRPLSAGTYRATFKVVGEKSTKSVKFKVAKK